MFSTNKGKDPAEKDPAEKGLAEKDPAECSTRKTPQHPTTEAPQHHHSPRARKRKSLSKRLLAVFFTVSFVVMCAATGAATVSSYTAYESKAENALLAQVTNCAQSFSAYSTDQMVHVLSESPFLDIRCTLIDADGTVLFDNYADISTLENHANREEVRLAKESGKVVVTRLSATLGSDTLYAASLVGDGVVLRLAESRVSLASFLGSMALPLALSLVVIFLISLLVSRALTKMITRPFSDIDLASPLDNDAYAEIQPLLERVDTQRRELKAQNAQLEQAVFTRREFTGNVSHEMKTPLQVIGGYAELMESGMVEAADVPRFAGLIRQEAESMRGLIDDVLTLSRLDERVDAPAMPVDLAAVAKRVCARLGVAANERSVVMQQEFDPQVVIQGDESLAEQMIYNLVSNAIKYNKEGGLVRVSVKRNEEAAVINVDDEGPGIPPDLRERVFERFFRVEGSRSRETGGTGLGLAIVKHAALDLGGSVHVEDSDLGGSRFVVTLRA